MADQKITDFPAVLSLASTDIIPVVQGGVNKKALISDVGTAVLTTPVSLGLSAAIDTDAPGGNGLNVTTTKTGTSTTPYNFGSQFVLNISPASASTSIFRAVYVRSDTKTNVDVTEAIGLSTYQYHSSSGLLGTQYGGTIQTRLFGSGNVTSGQGALCAARVGAGATGKYVLGRGATANAISDRTDHGIAFDNAVGLYATTRLTGDSIITDASTVEGEILTEASGGLITTARGGYFHSTIAAGSTITTAQLLRTKHNNSGTITTGYHLFMAAHTGSAPVTSYAIYGETQAASYLGGNLGIGDTSPTEASLVVDQTMPAGANPAALLVRSTDDGAAGVQITYEAKSTTPAVSDVIYTETAMGYNSAAAAKNYAFMSVSTTNVTAASEAARFNFGTFFAGASARRFSIGGGLFDAGSTDQGVGTINCLNGYYVADTQIILANKGVKPLATVGLIGTTTNDSPAAGSVGEIIESEVLAGSAVSATTGTALDVTSISLTAGHWEVFANIALSPNAATTWTRVDGWISTTSATLPTLPNKGAYARVLQAGSAGGPVSVIPVGSRYLKLSGTTTVYLSSLVAFAVNTMAVYGYIYAVRRR